MESVRFYHVEVQTIKSLCKKSVWPDKNRYPGPSIPFQTRCFGKRHLQSRLMQQWRLLRYRLKGLELEWIRVHL
jgi:hypothetical protein